MRSARRLGPLAASLIAALLSAAPARAGGPHHVYVSNEDGDDVAVIDAATETVVQRISVGKRPRGIRVARDGKHLYVALSGAPKAAPGVDESKLPPPDLAADGIGVVDLAAGKLVKVFPSGQDPETFDESPDGKHLFIANEATSSVTVLDVATSKILKKIPVGGEPEGVTVRPDGKVAYVTCEEDAVVEAIDTKTLEVIAKIPSGKRPRSVVFTRDGKTAFIANELDGTVTVADARKHVPIATIEIKSDAKDLPPPRPMGTALSHDGKLVFVSTGRAKSVAILDVATRTVKQTLPDVGARPWGVAVSPDGKTLYTANGSSDDVSIVDVATGKVRNRVKAGKQPWGVAVSSGRR